jgi:NAD(P)-dependent dehydrogenase (short-subunit alcohol dehydrogenase family)
MPESTPWTSDDMPDLTDKTVIVTGANSGLGREASRELARKGARVVLACRDLGKAGAAVDAILASHPESSVEAMELDLAHLASVRGFAEKFLSRYEKLHVLCNNAGVMALPRRTTADGFEMQFGTNHLGHFALTGLLLQRLLATPGARVVTTSSTAHIIGRMRFDDLQSERRYAKWAAYGQSKLANLLFAYELQRRLAARGASAISVATHPGYAGTNLQLAGPRMEGSALKEKLAYLATRLFSQSTETGALPTLYAATSPGVRGGDYIGPSDFFGSWGPPKKVQSNTRSHDSKAGARLWDVSSDLTGVHYTPLRWPNSAPRR